ncbi:hypothetical protein Aeh1hmmORF06c [Aeromonas phage Aeh1]|uniref:Uncharacterized protein n=1 Tax=Aeromonas phage Aeh1 TaxID=2880362 RepID=Q76YE5_9CAUD|nr:hypothetical protein Aeh1p300 [Aeromonas phage Aeh1]AAQ17950.1 hypothetical protein Aeh1hmmORF06c [Aeromonas phage Aeh1]
MFEENEIVLALYDGVMYLGSYVRQCDDCHIVKLEARNLTTSILRNNIWDTCCFNLPDSFRKDAINLLMNVAIRV